MMHRIRFLFLLGKPGITFSVGLTAITGYLMFTRSLNPGLWPVVLGVMLLSFGASAINHVQEAGTDRLMARTRLRPMPSGKLSPALALSIAVLAALSGFFILFFYTRGISALLGLFSLFWYNFIYTPLKKKTAFAVVPGSLVGALPPAIGWTAAGGYWLDPQILSLALFFFMGQMPHFWLILLKRDHEYRDAGFPTLQMFFSRPQIYRLIRVWIMGTAMSAMLLPAFGLSRHIFFSVFIILLTLAWAVWSVQARLYSSDKLLRKTFILTNIYYLLVMASLLADALWV